MSKDIKETENFITIENIKVPIEGEKNLLVLIRKANIEIPTFCYHSNLSTYGACRLCLVDIEGMGIQASCSIKPKVGMKVKVHTAQIREMRRVNVELLLASGYHECTTCSKNTFCKLQSLARQLGIKEIRFKKTEKKSPRDLSSDAIVRDPSKCILCGDCIRMCEEVQAVGAIDFAFRGSDTEVVPSLNKNLKDVECVYCGQCTRVCPTGALSPKSEVSKIWADLHDKKRKVAVQIAPAVRVAIGEKYDLAPGKSTTGLIVTALKMLGFDYVYDSSFSADLTIVEEANEFLDRFTKNKNMPQYTSCCPAWIRFVEQFYPELNKNLSTCKSPQQMLGALVKEDFVRKGGKRKDISMISVMPCSAKKHEAKREEFSKEQYADVDHVITTVGVSRMIDEMGIDFRNLKPSSFDLPFGFKTGAGVLFGASGGV
ncbi:MAG: 4Fe-4S binding protein, partial [Elusimicrobiaceae bacterium]|nr:4Fe-4S binding protein [Elusimicrobiaceae bacterium]